MGIDLTPDPAEESAQGQDLYRAPGSTAMMEDARDQAEASGWLPPEAASSWSEAPTLRIVQRRRSLYEAMQDLEAAAARASGHPDWPTRVGQALEALRTTLETHTAEIEADDGLFDQVIDRAPQLAAVVDDLRQDHVEMERMCFGVLDRVSEGADPTSLRRLTLDLLGALATHRQLGAELLYDAYNVEIGASD